ncbi:MAG: lanthionine synthetase LanC family protein [Saonia sp.]
MEQELMFKQKLKNITDIIQSKYKDVPDLGVITGISEMSLFQFYYSKYLDVDQYANLGVEMISYCIHQINIDYSFATYSTGLAGFGWTLQHLHSQNFLAEDCDDLLHPFDEYLYNRMKFDLEQGNYDFLHGALGYGFYFLNRYKYTQESILKTKYQSFLLELIDILDAHAIVEENCLKWKIILNPDKKNKGYSLGLAHGLSNIINFLVRLSEYDVFKQSTQKLIQGAINYILRFERNDNVSISLFPRWIEDGKIPNYHSRVAWCYGDLGIAVSLARAGKSLKDNDLVQHAMKIFDHTNTRRTPHSTMVKDAGICHGSYGNAHIYHRVLQEFDKKPFRESVAFWMEDGIQKAMHSDGYAGYKRWTPKYGWVPDLRLLEGIVGIGLVIIDYLSPNINTWDECLLLR